MKIYLIIALLHICGRAFSQPNNFSKTWITGINGIHMKFDNDPPTTYGYTPVIPYYTLGHANICDSSGDVILSSDGHHIYGNDGNPIEDGDSIVHSLQMIIEGGSSSFSQSCIFLPIDNKQYYFITTSITDSLMDLSIQGQGNINGTYDLLLYNKIDMSLNSGAGKVTQKMKKLLKDVELSKTQMMACRHGDGRSWWLLKQAGNVNRIYKFLFTQDSVYGPYIQEFQQPLFSYFDHGGQAVFSRDGSMYANVCRDGGKVFLADFDRCTGELTNPRVFTPPAVTTHNPNDPNETETFTEGLAFSPSGRFIYVSKYYNVQQLDLQNPDPNTAWQNVAGLDTAWYGFTQYSTLYLGPDDQLYIGNWSNQFNGMSAIREPDALGVQCDFQPKYLHFPDIGVSSPPCMANYSLGAANPICWPANIVEKNKKQLSVSIYPNPSNAPYLEFHNASLPVMISIYGADGKLLFSRSVNEHHYQLKQQLPAGNYVIDIVDKKYEQGTIKWVKG